MWGVCSARQSAVLAVASTLSRGTRLKGFCVTERKLAEKFQSSEDCEFGHKTRAGVRVILRISNESNLKASTECDRAKRARRGKNCGIQISGGLEQGSPTEFSHRKPFSLSWRADRILHLLHLQINPLSTIHKKMIMIIMIILTKMMVITSSLVVCINVLRTASSVESMRNLLGFFSTI